jgi:hypothetical protein
MLLSLTVQFGEVWHRQHRRANPRWSPEQNSLQPVLVQILAKRPLDAGSFGSLQVLVYGSEPDRATAGDLPPRPTENFNRRTSLILRTDNLLAGKLILPLGGGFLPFCCPAPLSLWKSFRLKPNAIPGSA